MQISRVEEYDSDEDRSYETIFVDVPCNIDKRINVRPKIIYIFSDEGREIKKTVENNSKDVPVVSLLVSLNAHITLERKTSGVFFNKALISHSEKCTYVKAINAPVNNWAFRGQPQ